MRLEHVNLVVKDFESSLVFYRAVMPHWKIRSKGNTEWNGQPRKWIHFGDDYNYIAFNDSGSGENRDLADTKVGLAHIAFETENIAQLQKRLKSAGFEPRQFRAKEPFRKNLYYIDPDGFEVEFVEYSSDIPSERNRDS